MNRKMILHITGLIACIEAGLMLLPALVALIYREEAGYSFLISIGIAGLLGFLATRDKPQKKAMFAKDGFVAVSLCWVVLSLLGALPFVISGRSPAMWTLCLRRFPALRPQAPVSLQMWKA